MHVIVGSAAQLPHAHDSLLPSGNGTTSPPIAPQSHAVFGVGLAAPCLLMYCATRNQFREGPYRNNGKVLPVSRQG